VIATATSCTSASASARSSGATRRSIEESPSAGITPEVRAALCDGAVALARHVGYEGAGTVEFMVGADRDGAATITFLEVNTRLQVEHPVTEAVTGLDLVELQLLVAAGEPLPITQDDVTIDGHAIEVRVVAEDPAAGWMPSTGRIGRFRIGSDRGADRADGGEVRVDTGVRDGSEISSDYDSLVAKVIVHAPTRDGAARRLARALRSSQITGIRTNLDSLVAILGEADFLAADTPTAYLDEHPEVSLPPRPLVRPATTATRCCSARCSRWSVLTVRTTTHAFAPSGWRNLRTQGQRQIWLDPNGEQIHVEYEMSAAWQPGGDALQSATVRLGPWPEPDETGALGVDERPIVRCGCSNARPIGVDRDRRSPHVDRRRGRPSRPDLDDDGIGAVTVHARSAAGCAVPHSGAAVRSARCGGGDRWTDQSRCPAR
jgi:propionyl-CoA carboxylase alpha chain